MKFLKTYWWVFALLIGAFLAYWFLIRKDSSIKPFVCNNTKAQWDSKMAAQKQAIQNDAAWLARINTELAEGMHTDLAQGLTKHAEWKLRMQNKECNPYLPHNSMDQFGV